MNLKVDKDKCIGCGQCVMLTDEKVFKFNDDNQAEVVENPIKEENIDMATEAMNSCPTGAIVEE